MEYKDLLSQLVCHVVHQDQSLFFLRNSTFVADIGASQCVVTRDHNTTYFRLLEFLNGCLGFRFQLVLKHLKAVKIELSFDILPPLVFHLLLCYGFTGNGQHPEPMRCVLLKHLIVVFRYGGVAHDIQHHLRRTFGKYLIFIACGCFCNHTHPLQFGLELIPTVDYALMPSLAAEGKNCLGVVLGEADLKFTKIEGFYLHGVSDQLACGLYFDDGVVGGDVVEDGEVVGLLMRVVGDVLGHFLGVDNLGVKFPLIAGHTTVEIHEVLGEGASFIKTGKLDHPARYNFILLNTKYLLLLQFLYCVNDAKGHADGEGWRNCYQYEIYKFIDDIDGGLVFYVDDGEGDVGYDCEEEEEE